MSSNYNYYGIHWPYMAPPSGPSNPSSNTRSPQYCHMDWTPTQATYNNRGYSTGGYSNREFSNTPTRPKSPDYYSMPWSPAPAPATYTRSMSIDSILNQNPPVQPQHQPSSRYDPAPIVYAAPRPLSLLMEPANIDLRNHARNAAASGLDHYNWQQEEPAGVRRKQLREGWGLRGGW